MPVFNNKEDLKIQLDKIGYKELADGKTMKSVVVQLPRGSDRVATLIDISNKLKKYSGAKYNPNGGSSSVGRVEFSGNYYVECKIKGGGGSGAGSDLTKLVESAQCVYNAAHFNGNPYTHSGLKKSSNKYNIDEKIDNILTKLPDDWVISSKKVAETLKKKFNNKSYVHHRGSEWVNKLYAHVRYLNKEAGKPFGDENKWNPADIWMVSPKGETALRELLKTENLPELNNLLLKYYKSKDIIGVSLKKVERNNVNFKELNMSSTRPTFKYKNMTTGLRGFFQSGDAYLEFDGGRAQFRRFGTTWQAELKGKSANMGKMSGGPVKGLVDMISGPSGQKFIPQKLLSERNEETIDMFYDWYNAAGDTPKMKKYEFYQEVMNKDMNWFVSKIMSTQLAAIVTSFNKEQKDRFASGLVNYAGSESELSGPYCKVY